MSNRLSLFISVIILISAISVKSQGYTRADSLRGILSPLRTCFDVTFYHLDIKVDIPDKSISGSNEIYYNVLRDFDTIQIDLFSNMKIDSIIHGNRNLNYKRDENVVFVYFDKTEKKDINDKIKVCYHGKPKIAKKPPWDGGFVWTKDRNGKDWVAVACESIGASLWYPNKDHLSDKPDSMMISCSVPSELKCVSNGTMRRKIDLDNGFSRYDWFVSYPILNYNATICVGDYINFYDYSVNGKDSLKLNYYVFEYNLNKAKKQFSQVKPLLKCYEKFLGPYPFQRDGYKLIETPFAGMEHQSAIAYGNDYANGYFREDYSLLKLPFDYIIIHETGHEWWGNSVSMGDLADMWIHEAFCTYSEALYVECMYGAEMALKYLNKKKFYIQNDKACIPDYNFNIEGSQDMYSKGALMINTIRSVIDNDRIFYDILYGIQRDYRYKTVSYNDIVMYFNTKSGKNLSIIFNQYLKHTYPPVFRYKLIKKDNGLILRYKWEGVVDKFDMPIKITTKKNKFEFIYPTTNYKEIVIPNMKEKNFKIADDLFYVYLNKIS